MGGKNYFREKSWQIRLLAGLFLQIHSVFDKINPEELQKFYSISNKWFIFKTDYSKVIEEKKNENHIDEKKEVESKLDPDLQHLLKLICNIQAMEETMTELEYDATKAPLGGTFDSLGF